MACWHVCRTFTGSVKEKECIPKKNQRHADHGIVYLIPTYPQYHYNMSTPIQRLDSFIKFYLFCSKF